MNPLLPRIRTTCGVVIVVACSGLATASAPHEPESSRSPRCIWEPERSVTARPSPDELQDVDVLLGVVDHEVHEQGQQGRAMRLPQLALKPPELTLVLLLERQQS